MDHQPCTDVLISIVMVAVVKRGLPYKVCLKSPGTDVGAAGFGMGVPGLLRQTL